MDRRRVPCARDSYLWFLGWVHYRCLVLHVHVYTCTVSICYTQRSSVIQSMNPSWPDTITHFIDSSFSLLPVFSSFPAFLSFPVFSSFSLRPCQPCESRHHYASCPTLSISPLPASCCIHCSGNDKYLSPDEGTRPWLVPDEGTRTWDHRPRSLNYNYDYRSDNNYWPKSWASNHPERY